ncbi:hypothetical protein ACFPDQ_03835 [Pseudofrancisella aestuarii]|uniref:SGNH/GDSL hydrolase family protein n=1 Tax=Pseudofrancisella aestuarii TaxID=2670347 RepID=A0ABV9TAL6_9GAMM|nr:hypothetical protein [Pseudofrancisella aestuarii]
MKLRKLLLATTLAIPAMGYCGFIDWIQGYPEVKEKIEQKLEQQYHGEKFDVSGISYSDNLGGYNFDYKPSDKKSDAEYSGSYFPKTDRLLATGYMWSSIGKQWQDMFKPYIDKVGTNYLIIGGLGSGSPGSGEEDKATQQKYFNQVNDSLAYMFKTGSAEEWIAVKHDYIRGNISLFIDVPETTEGIYKTLQMIESINNKLRSFHLYSYKLEVITYKVPQGFNIDNYFDEVKGDFHTTHAWWFVEGIQKYAWGYFNVRGCMPTNAFEKACNTQYGNSDLDSRKEGVLYNTTADRLNNLQDITNQFRLVDEFGVAGKCTPSGSCYAQWAVNSRANTQLKDIQYYSDLEKLISENK